MCIGGVQTCRLAHLSDCLSESCIVAKRPIGYGCRLVGEWARSMDKCIRWVELVERRAVLGVNVGHPIVTNGDFVA